MTNTLTRYTCPDCGGAVERFQDGALVQYRCRIGHLYFPLSAFSTHTNRVENTLWSAVVLLEENAEIAEEIASLESGELSDLLVQAAQEKRTLAERARQIAREFPATIPSVR